MRLDTECIQHSLASFRKGGITFGGLVETTTRLTETTRPVLLKINLRDMGEVVNDLSMPIDINGRHWGAVRVGFDSGRLV